MTRLYTFSRFNPAWGVNGAYPDDVWTHISDTDLAEVSLERDYLPAEDRYVAAVLDIFRLARVDSVRVLEKRIHHSLVERHAQSGWQVEIPTWRPSGLGGIEPIIRGGLRDQVWCRLWSAPVEVTFGFDLYVHVFSRSPEIDFAPAVAGHNLFWEERPRSELRVELRSYDLPTPDMPDRINQTRICDELKTALQDGSNPVVYVPAVREFGLTAMLRTVS